MFKSEKTYKILVLVLFIALAVSLPLYKKLSLSFVWLILLLWLAEGNFKEKYKRFVSTGNVFVRAAFLLLPLLYLAGVFYSANLDQAMFRIEQKASLLLIPIVLFSFHPVIKTKEFFIKIMYSFIFGIITAGMICLIRAFLRYQETGSLLVFYYSEFSMFHHPGYFALYAAVAVAGLLYIIDCCWKRYNILIKSFLISALLLILVFTFLLSSKAGILSVLIVFAVAFLVIVVVRKKYLFALIAILALIILILAGTMIFSFAGDRFLKNSLTEKNMEASPDGVGVRLTVWKSSLSVIKKYPLFGVGTGDFKDVMAKEYLRSAPVMQKVGFRNAHNQFLETTVTLGITGGIALMLWLLVPFRLAFHKNHYFYLSFLLVIFFNFLVESMLETQSGIMFIVFMHTWFFVISDNIDIRW
ncbi:MAG: O-antigen ligase family protein [Bacteroidales bacterium]|nr:O-antigen ligase family protein [Bacteroidales bacterium]